MSSHSKWCDSVEDSQWFVVIAVLVVAVVVGGGRGTTYDAFTPHFELCGGGTAFAGQ